MKDVNTPVSTKEKVGGNEEKGSERATRATEVRRAETEMGGAFPGLT